MKKLLKLRGFYLFLGLAGGTFGPYLTLLLVHNGLDSGQIGMLMATGALIAIVIQPMWGIISDRYNRARLVLLLSVAVPALLAVFYRSEYFIVLMIVYTLSTIFSSTQAPIADSYAIVAAKRAGSTYGSIRLMLSFGAAVGSYAGGWYVSAFSVSTIWVPFVLFNFLAVAIAFTLPKQAEENHMMNQSFAQGVRQLIRNRVFLAFLGGSFLVNQTDHDGFRHVFCAGLPVGGRIDPACGNCLVHCFGHQCAVHAVCIQDHQKAGQRAYAADRRADLCPALGYPGGLPLSFSHDRGTGAAWIVLRPLLHFGG